MVLNPLTICSILVVWYNKCGISLTGGLGRWVLDIRSLMSLQSFVGQKLSVNRAWKGVWVAVVSKIWSYRNKVVFKGGIVDADEIFSLFGCCGLSIR